MMRRVLQVALPVFVLGIGLYGSWWLTTHRKTVTAKSSERFKPRVESLSVKRVTFRPEIHSQGTAMPRREIGLSPVVSGRVVWVSPQLVVGGLFDQGTELVRIDRGDYELALRQATADIQTAQAGMTNALAKVASGVAQVAQAQALITREEAEAAAARAEWKLLGRKGEPAALLVREPQLREARATKASAEALTGASRAQFESGKAVLAAAEAVRDQALVNLKRCQLFAPFKGRVQSQSIGLGQLVSRGSVLAKIQPVAVAEVRLPLPIGEFKYLDLNEAMRGGIVDGPEVELSSGGEIWGGKIVRAEGEVDTRTRMITVVASVPGPYASGKPPLSFGRFVRARIDGRAMEGVVVLPRAALREGSGVYVLRNGKLFSQPVTLAWSDRARVVIDSGLKEGERVCLSPLDSFVEGMEVRSDE
ncbi:MAG: efflux RND transporter periplasmic adaptor subunit [Verrucomicrobia subdivision 3 bacterium]|nr:efflux RND transporter periplasmic adaptor subunit [Limisphaerales bacterium]